MLIDILGDKTTAAYSAIREVIVRLNHTPVSGKLFAVDLAVAPLLTTRVPDAELQSPRWGTLIFHPSPLPYGRGASAIRWAYRRREPLTAATWFWATDELDAGDICEQEIIKIDYSLRPRLFYEKHIIPAMVRTFERCLSGLESGIKRQIKQIEEYATYDGRIE